MSEETKVDAPVNTEEPKPAEETTPVEKPAEEPKPIEEGTAFEAGEEKPAEEKPAEEDKPGEKEEKPAEEGTVVEQALSEVELPEGFTVSEEDQAAVGEIATTHELGKDAVKDLIALQTKREQARVEAGVNANKEFVAGMKADAMKLPAETRAACNRFVKKFGGKSLLAKMTNPDMGIGNDVDLIQAFATAQKAVDGGFVDGELGGGGAEQSRGQKLYGKTE